MMMRMLATGTLVTLAFATDVTPGAAQPRPQTQVQVSRGATDRAQPAATPRSAHLVFGTLTSVKGAMLVLRRRSGALQSVDAAPAIASGKFSAPLFAGKIVAVSGTLDAARVLHAQSIVRLTRIEAGLPADR